MESLPVRARQVRQADSPASDRYQDDQDDISVGRNLSYMGSRRPTDRTYACTQGCSVHMRQKRHRYVPDPIYELEER